MGGIFFLHTMPLLFERTTIALGNSHALLPGEHFQSAYLTNDIDRACQLFAEQLGVASFQRLEGEIPSGGHIRVELAWVGSVMYELMQTTDSVERVYASQPQPDDQFTLVHHHLGYVASDRQQWDQILASAQTNGFEIAYRNRTEGFLEVCFIYVPWLPHYLEYFLLEPAGQSFLQDVPKNPLV